MFGKNMCEETLESCKHRTVADLSWRGNFENSNLMRFSIDGDLQATKTVNLSGSHFSIWPGLAPSSSGGFYASMSSLPGQGTYQQSIVYVK
jgi:hypothetical protein